MSNNLRVEIHECYRRAVDCARQAAAQTDPKTKEDLLDLERRWLSLAREILTDFSDEKKPTGKTTGKRRPGLSW